MSTTRALVARVYSHRLSLVAYARSIVGNSAEAEDVVQEATVRLLDACAAPGDAAKATPAYFRRSVRNAALDLLRRRSRERQAALSEVSWVADPIVPPTPEEMLQYRQSVGELEAAIADLPEAQRKALTMHRLGGCRLREIADRLGVSVPTAHRLVRDGLASVAAHMASRGK
ncbi:MAG: RNA polymerase sigma factor [Pseudomonadota bacterium]